ncbi:DUF916 and DUF3324 domain-containing protein [Lactococcus lactis]|uniref:DUF916 and DUF3324 domain-containing protein n=1 Tax=Lactococcus lactis TaxID=1358 RepID=A0A9X4S6M9_9LACT|nr:DUF916 and DUF3324 domain-containing protein [Lactococcus lactis]MDG4984171.1 DUF916 and DUF3324 domain-containing protein [Lactococcus lactis]
MIKKYSSFTVVIKMSLILVFVLSLFLCNKNADASTSSFNVSPVIPANQINGNLGYFNLLMKANSQQELSFTLSNTTSKSITVDISFSRSTTNQNGIAVYDSLKEENDSSLKYNISDYVDIPQKEVKLAAHSQTTVRAKISMPKTSFIGVLAGGFSFKEKQKEHQSGNSKGVSITNEYKYIIALVIQQNTIKISPQLKLNRVQAGQVNSRNVIETNLQNIAPVYLQNMNVKAFVKGVTHPNLKYEFENSEMKMAPNSNFDLAIPVSVQGSTKLQTSKILEPGKYHLSMVVYGEKSTEGPYQSSVNGQIIKYKYKWKFEKNFEIKGSQANKLNSSDPTVHYKEPISWLMIIGILLVFIVLLLIFLLFTSKRKDNNYK